MKNGIAIFPVKDRQSVSLRQSQRVSATIILSVAFKKYNKIKELKIKSMLLKLSSCFGKI